MQAPSLKLKILQNVPPFATLKAVIKAVSKILLAGLFVKVELLVFCQSDLIVESSTHQFIGRNLPTLAWESKVILIDHEKVLIMKPDIELIACVHTENYNIVRTGRNDS